MEEKKTATEKLESTEGFLKVLFKSKRIIITSVIVLILACVCIGIFTSRKSKVDVAIRLALKDVNVISELSTLIVPYNSVYKAVDITDTESDIKYKYYVAYEGKAILGLDFDKIDIKKDEINKRIIIVLPQIKVQDVYVDPVSIDVIYMDKKYNTEGATIEHLKECNDDLYNKANNKTHIKELAKESAEVSIANLLNPIINHIDNSYKIDFE